VNIEILEQRIPTSRYRLIVRNLSRVVESVQVDSASHEAGHHEYTGGGTSKLCLSTPTKLQRRNAESCGNEGRLQIGDLKNDCSWSG